MGISKNVHPFFLQVVANSSIQDAESMAHAINTFLESAPACIPSLPFQTEREDSSFAVTLKTISAFSEASFEVDLELIRVWHCF